MTDSPLEVTALHHASETNGKSSATKRSTLLDGFSRRAFLALACAALADAAEPVIDIHQHTNYHGRSDQQLIAHQRAMGISKTVLLPAGSKYGLAAGCGGNDTVVRLAKQNPGMFVFFANELPDIPETRSTIEKYLKAGAIGIGEQKFHVECDSPAMCLIADIAKHFDVPVLMHFQYQTYNLGFERFHKCSKSIRWLTSSGMPRRGGQISTRTAANRSYIRRAR